MKSLLAGRPSLLNALHALRLAGPQSSTTFEELDCLARFAAGRKTAVEIGTDMGVSAAVIASSIAADGRLYCVDPWRRGRFKENPSWSICNRELKRRGLLEKVVYVRHPSGDSVQHLPATVDFMFIDGDHSTHGIATDWEIAKEKIGPGGIVCFHDTSVPPDERHSHLDSVDFFREVISAAPGFVRCETCHTLNVMRRVTG
jgi:predicted O-methyltransferase YrrM